MKNSIKQIQVVTLLTLAMVVTPGISQAGWLSDKKENAKARVQKVTKKAKAKAGNVQDKVQDMVEKLNEIHEQIAENRPLMDKVKNGKMMDSLVEVVEFIGEQQQEYQHFANSGVHVFRGEFKEMLMGFGDVINAVPGMENAERLNDQLDNALDLIDIIPSQFLFLMKKAVGKQLSNINSQIRSLNADLAKLPKLPTLRDVVVGQAPSVEECKAYESRETAVILAKIQGTLKGIIWMLNTITSYLPNDLTVEVNAVAGGGFTVGVHPAKVPFKIPLTILEGVQLTLDSSVSIATAMCKGVVPNK